MPQVALVTDSTADLAPELASQNQITVVPLTLHIGGKSFLDGIDIQSEDFYQQLEETGTATTSQPSVGRFAEVYQELLKDHQEILSLHISGDLSGTLAAARQAAELVAPERIKVVDTRLVTMALGLLVLAAAQKLKEGLNADEAWERIQPISKTVKLYVLVETLECLRRGGRIGRAEALFGSMLQIKPLITLSEGQVAPLERVRTTEKALNRISELALSNGSRLVAAIGHGNASQSAERLASKLEGHCDSLLRFSVGAVVGAHAGPGVVGVACYPIEDGPNARETLHGGAA